MHTIGYECVKPNTHTLINPTKSHPTLPTLTVLTCFHSSLKLIKCIIF